MLEMLAYFFLTAVLYTLPVSATIWLLRRRLSVPMERRWCAEEPNPWNQWNP